MQWAHATVTARGATISASQRAPLARECGAQARDELASGLKLSAADPSHGACGLNGGAPWAESNGGGLLGCATRKRAEWAMG